jgi:hypothetical protein
MEDDSNIQEWKDATSECDEMEKGELVVCSVVDEEALDELLRDIEPQHGFKSIPDAKIPRKKRFAILLEKWNTYGIVIGRVRFQNGEEQYVDMCECQKAF